jgi:hypothetical protein
MTGGPGAIAFGPSSFLETGSCTVDLPADATARMVRACESRTQPGGIVYLIRDIMYCKPGKVRPLLEKFKQMNQMSEKVGMPRMRIMTDLCAEQYWTLVSEMEVASLQAFEDMEKMQGSPEDMKEFERIMSGYHDLVDHGKREIYRVEQ